MTDAEVTEEVQQAEPEQPVEREETFEEKEDRVLMELDGEPDPDDLEPVGEGREAEGGDPEGGAEESPSPLSEQQEEALQILRRDGWDQADLEALPEERLIAIAEHRKKMQADVDRMLRDRQQPEAAPETAEDSEASTAEPNSDQPTISANLEEQAKAFADYLGLDEDGASKLVQMQQSVVEPMQQVINQQQDMLQTVSQQIMFMDLERARTELVSDYPQIADVDGEGWDRVLNRMVTLYDDESSGERPTAQVMEDAILLEFRDDIAQQAKQTKQQVRNFRDDGLPTATRSNPEPRTYSTPEERQDAVLRMLESDDPNKVAKARAIGRPDQ